MLDDLMFLCRMMSTMQWSRLETSYSFSDFLLLLRHVATVAGARKCCSSQVSSCVAQPRYLWNMRYTTRWLCITEPDTVRTETERAPTSPDVTHLHDSSLYRAQKTNALHPRMDRPILCCLCTCSTRCSWAHTSRRRAQKFWEYDSQELRCVKQTSENSKDRRSEKFKSKVLISAVRTLWNLRTDLRRRRRIGSRDEGLHKSDDGCDSQRRSAKKKEVATISVKEFDLFVTVLLLEDTQAVLSLGKLCEDHGCNYHWASGQKPQLMKHGRKRMQYGEVHTNRCPWSIDKLFKLIFTHISYIFVRGNSSCGPVETDNPNKNDDNEDKLEPNRKRLRRSFLESLYVDTTQIGNKWHCWDSTAQSERRYVCCIVAITSGWEMVGRFNGMLLPSAKHLRSLVWWEDTVWKTFWRTFLKDQSFIDGPVIQFGVVVEHHLIKDLSRLHQFGPKVLPGIFLGCALHGGQNLERRHIGRRHWGTGRDGRIWNFREKTQHKGSVKAHEWWQFYIPDRRWNGTTLWRRSVSENIHLNLGLPRPRKRIRKSSRRIRRSFFNRTSRLIVVWWWS